MYKKKRVYFALFLLISVKFEGCFWFPYNLLESSTSDHSRLMFSTWTWTTGCFRQDANYKQRTVFETLVFLPTLHLGHGGRKISRQEQEVCSWIFKHGNGNYIWTASRTTALLLPCILRFYAIVIQGLTGPFFFYTSSSIITTTAQVTTYFSNCLLFCANKPLKRVS